MKLFAKFLFLAAIAANAQGPKDGLKDVYANKFRFGTILNENTVKQSAMTDIVKKEFNSITPENELKPDKTIVCSGSTNDNIQVTLSNAATILKFCEDNNIPMRGHTLVWHSQSPECFFRENMASNSGNWVTSKIMDGRMESYIKNMFAAIKSQYPNLNLYAYDVVNEAAKTSDAGPRDPGTGSEQSKWVQVYGDDSFIEKAFRFARQYAPPETKLFYNDFNEHQGNKMNYIAEKIVKPLHDSGYLDGMGMQAHLDVRKGPGASSNPAWPSISDYTAAIKKYKDIGVEIQITEMDATLPEGNQEGWNDWDAQASYYGQIMNAVLTQGGDAVTAFVVWGIKDSDSWRKTQRPLLWDSTGKKKAAYDTLHKKIPELQWGDGDNFDKKDGVHELKININPEGSGGVARNPSHKKYAEGDVVTLMPNPNIGWNFKNWSGDITGTQAKPTITMNGNKTVTANFELSSGDDYNLIRNGNFSGEANWTLNKWDNSTGSITTSGGKATIAMTKAPDDGKAWNFQLVQNGISLITGYTYRLTFDASAASARSIGLVMQMDVDPWTGYFDKDVSLTTATQTFTYEFEMTDPTDENGRIAFNIGGATPTVTLSNVRLVYAAAPAGSGSSSSSGAATVSSSSGAATVSSSSRGSSSSVTSATSSSSSSSRGSSSSIASNISSSSGGSLSSSSSDNNSNSPIRLLSSISNAAFKIQTMSDGSLLIDANSQTAVEIYDLKGNKIAEFNVLRGLQKVSLSLPSGVYFAKAHGLQITKFTLK